MKKYQNIAIIIHHKKQQRKFFFVLTIKYPICVVEENQRYIFIIASSLSYGYISWRSHSGQFSMFVNIKFYHWVGAIA